MLHEAINGLVETIGAMGYIGLFLLMAMESSLIPIPSEIIMPPAGYLVQQGKMDMGLVIISGTAGSLFGAYCNYFGARWLGRPLLIKYGHYVLINEHRFYQVEQFFNHHGEISTFIGRLLPVIRHLISLPAGLARMNHGKFSFYTLLGAWLWVSLLTYLGYFLGENQAVIQQYAHQLIIFVIIFSVLLIGLYLGWYRRKAIKSL